MASVEHFKCDVRRFDNIDSEINVISEQLKPLNLKLKDLRKVKTELQNTICDFMQTNEIGECKLAKGALLFKETKNVLPLSKNSIKENILLFLKEHSDTHEYKNLDMESKATMLFQYVYEKRDYSEKKVLERINI